MLKKFYEKSEIWFSVAFIIAYCIIMSAGDALSAHFGIEKSATLAVGLVLCAVIIIFLKKNGLFRKYGLCRPAASARSMLFYIPVFLMLSANLWLGVTLNYSVGETVLYILSMLCVGFLEEIIFRGMLFVSMEKDTPRAAIIVSSITFGMGHIINLFNGSGAELIPNILQIVYATAAGFMFVMIYVRSRSLIVPIAAHGAFNALSAFTVAPGTLEIEILTCVLLTVITGGYALYLALNTKKSKKKVQNREAC